MSEDNPDQRYRGMFDWSRFPVGNQKELVYSPMTYSTHIVSSGKVRLLQGCKNMDTLDAHAERLSRQLNIGADRLPAVRQQLVELVNAGLLVSFESLTGQLRKHSLADDAPPNIASLGIPTRNRPEVLKRCLDSYAACAKLYGRDELKFLVMDQSDDATDQQTNQQSLAAVKAKYGIESQYLTRNDAEHFARLSCEHADVSPDVVNFALLNVYNMPLTFGMSRNLLLLNTVGDLTVQVDDDTICRVIPCRESGQGLTLTSEYAPQQFWFLSESETASLGEGFTTENFFALHEQLLGRSIASCVEGEPSGQLNLDEINSGFFRRLSTSGARVCATAIGVGGESGMDGSAYLLTMENKSRARLVRTESEYRFALSHHQVLRCVSTATISGGSLMAGHNQGFDNRHFLPPFFPVMRGEYVPYGEMLKLSPVGTSPVGTFNGYLPWHVLHKPDVLRTYSSDHLRLRASRLSFSVIVQALLQSFIMGRERSPERSIESLGKSLFEWGSAPIADFEEMLTLLLVRRASLQIIAMEEALKQSAGLPLYWAADLNMCINAMREALGQKDYIVGCDLVDNFGLEEARKMQQLLVRRFGELLQSWSAIRAAAYDLRLRGSTVQ